MTNPVRIQLSRKKGFNLQEYSKSLNGLECIKCDRTTRWGNPFKVQKCEYECIWHIQYFKDDYKEEQFDKKSASGFQNGNYVSITFLTKEEAIKTSIKLFKELIEKNTKILKFNEFKNLKEYTKFYNKNINSLLIKDELKGKNLACWCPCDSPCHCDVLLEIANKK